MKKVLIFLLTLIIGLGAFSFAGCSNKQKLRIQCSLCDDYFSLPIKHKGTFLKPSRMCFSSDNSLEYYKNLCDAADYGENSVETTLYDGVLLIKKTDSEDKCHYYVLSQVNKAFYFICPSIMLVCDGIGEFSVYFPFMFLNDPTCRIHETAILISNTFYSTDKTVKDFAAFYSKLDEFETVQNGDVLEVKENFSDNKIIITFKENTVAVDYEANDL